ncbi:MAG: DinB family protein [Actinomycetota bacterium]|nr:DinB family protein [Actinomycetota bacterium]
MDRCDECGFVYDTVARDDLPSALRELATAYVTVLGAHGNDVLRAHPISDTWSALEYSCHVRDVLRVQRERVLRALAEDEPAFPGMRRDERVTEERYNEQRPADVGRDITVAADEFGRMLASLDDDGWMRTGVYNWPTTQVRTVEWIGRHTIHEGEHHLQDIDRLVTAA